MPGGLDFLNVKQIPGLTGSPFMSPILTELLAEIDNFLAARDLSESKFGLAVMGDKHFVRELRKGRDCQASTIDRVRQFIDDHRAAA